MGAWAEGSFSNDDALDWVQELEGAQSIAPLEDALETMAAGDGYLEAPDCCMALAAAEVVAALRKQPAAELPAEVKTYVGRIKDPPPVELVARAMAVVQRIRTKSELQELWAESDAAEKWLASVDDLAKRLR